VYLVAVLGLSNNSDHVHKVAKIESYLISTEDFYLNIFTQCYNKIQSNIYIYIY